MFNVLNVPLLLLLQFCQHILINLRLFHENKNEKGNTSYQLIMKRCPESMFYGGRPLLTRRRQLNILVSGTVVAECIRATREYGPAGGEGIVICG